MALLLEVTHRKGEPLGFVAALAAGDGWPLDITETEITCRLLRGGADGPLVAELLPEKTLPEVGMWRADATQAETAEWPEDVLFGEISYRTAPGPWHRKIDFCIHISGEFGFDDRHIV